MSETKGERREKRQRKERYGMQVTGKNFWRAIANSQVKRDQGREAKRKQEPSHEKDAG